MSINLGAAIYISLKPILKIYSILIVGYLLARYDIVSMESSRGISNMVVNSILPCLTFNKIVSNISDKDIKAVGVIVLSAVLLFAVGGSCSLLARLVTPVPQKWFWGLLFAGIFPNISDLPIAYVQSLGGGFLFDEASAEKGVAYCCIFLISQSFLMMNFGLWRLVGLDFKSDQDSELEEGLNNATPNSLSKSSSQHLNATSRSTPRESQESYELRSMSSNAIESDSQEEASRNGLEVHSLAESVKSLTGMPTIRTTTTSRTPRAFSTTSSPSALESSRIKPYYTAGETDLSWSTTVSRSRRSSMRKGRPSMSDVIQEYSVADQIKDGEIDLTRPLTLTEDLGYRNAFDNVAERNEHQWGSEDQEGYSISRTSTSHSNRGKKSTFIANYRLQWLEYIAINFIRPASLGALLGIIVAMIPWVKALFVHTDVHVHNAPDGQPVLNFLMDFTAYIGNACVPLGLLLLGGTIARLEIKKLPKGFLKVALLMTVCRLMVIPIIGVAWANKLYKINWLESTIAKFVMILTWSMPSATAQVYFTAFYTPLEGTHTQLDCLSVLILMQYAILFITVPFVVTYTIKVDLQM